MMTETLYEILELSRDAGFAEIEGAYRRLRPLYDRDPERQRQIDEAWRTLINPIQKKRYDESLHNPSSSGPSRSAPERATRSGPQSQQGEGRGRTEVISLSDGYQGEKSGFETQIHPPPPVRDLGRSRRAVTDVVTIGTHEPERGEREQPAGRDRKHEVERPQEFRHGGRAPTDVVHLDRPEQVERSEAVSAAAARLVLVHGGRRQAFDLKPEGTLIGRPTLKGPDPDVPLPDSTGYVSRQHAQVRLEGDRWVVVDRSQNGTFLNGRRLEHARPAALWDGDVIVIEGRSLTFYLAS